ncbi:hypothetical protein [Kitasatospora sp. NPDC097643]|uniref:hypothetical protein n=1 Tax=Kitasatospora sp. NPDC097643 TaxID=3157230 RepID=UPI00332001C2
MGGIANLGGSVFVSGGGVRTSRAPSGSGICTDTALPMTAGSVTGNTATVDGGGIHENAGSVTLVATGSAATPPDNCAATPHLPELC